MVRIRATGALCGFLAALLLAAPSPARPADPADVERANAEADAVTARQSVDVFCSLQDGQPGTAGEIEGQIDTGWATGLGGRDTVLQVDQLKYTPEASGLLRGAQWAVSVPVFLGQGSVNGSGDVTLAWSQRWVVQRGSIPTLSTLASIRAPTGVRSSGVDGSLTGVIADDVGPLTFYLNGTITSANGQFVRDPRPLQWSAVAGAKWRLRETDALVADVVHATSVARRHGAINLLEAAWQHDFHGGPSIGPGIAIGLDDHEETPSFAAGIRVAFGF